MVLLKRKREMREMKSGAVKRGELDLDEVI